MRRHLVAAGIAAAALIPTFAFAQQSCEQAQNNRTAGTVAGAGLGALFGSAVAGRGDRTTGAVLGGIGGAILGNQLSKSSADCSRAYGYYDNNGLWHASGVNRANAQGYYDRGGTWVQGAPNGYYNSQGTWTVSATSASAAGYYDRENRWVPASASGYYDTSDRWVAGSASGYYDTLGRWVAGPATGRYDNDGRWMAGQANGRLENGVWIEAAQPGYYDNGRWRAGEVTGYYDTQGRWIGTSAQRAQPVVYQQGRTLWDGAPSDARGRQAWLDQRIRQGINDGTLTRNNGDEALRSLNEVRRQEANMRHDRGRLSRRDEATILARLDIVGNNIRWSRDNDRRYGRRDNGRRGD